VRIDFGTDGIDLVAVETATTFADEAADDQRRLAEFRALIQEGLDSGPSAPLDIEDIKRRGREILAAEQNESRR